jgi:beta-lactamase superfamily II metal-dependent hydrolase
VANAIRIGMGNDRDPSSHVMQPKDADYPLTVAFLDVGQGDGIVIRCEDTVLVVDGGERDEANVVPGYLREQGITTLDCYIASHPHSDHIGAAAAVFSAAEVKCAMMTEFSEINIPTTKSYERLLTSIQNEECEVIYAKAGDTYTFGPLSLDIFAPVEELGDYNNMSIVFKMTYKKNTFLFTGDMQTESEELILDSGCDLHADVLKMGHHGSSDSCTLPFFSAVSPVLAVISCGKDNDYGHPHRETIEMLEDAGVRYYRTDLNGTVTVYGDGKDIFVK